MRKDELEDTEELFPIAFPNSDKDVIRIMLMFHSYVMLEHEAKDEKTKNLILTFSNFINQLFRESEDNEEIPMPYELIVILYKTFMLCANVKHTPAIHKIFSTLTQAGKTKHVPADVETLLRNSQRIAKHYITYINDTYGQVPLVKQLRLESEKNWRSINASPDR